MDMKRFVLLVLLIALAGETTWAGVRLDLDAGLVSGSSASLIAVEADLEGQTSGETSSSFFGEGVTVQTPPLVATLSASLDSASTLEIVTFDASRSLSRDGVITLYEWDLDGDGNFDASSSSETFGHVYTEPGVVLVQVRVTSDLGESALSEALKLEIVNRSPIARFEVNLGDTAEDSLLQFLDRSNDLDGEIVHVAWNFGDGTYQAGSPSSDDVYSHTFTVSGTHTVTLYVIDNDGGMASTQSTVEVL